ncbi:chloride channel protein [Deinococcus hopiensis]|uniref:H+/Cl-antiporter ClcA n=1 Tax=Deinococcus hopiensis KR-140 TaxID=695939 RepID=A0A1W1VI36_9DEIO|nr:chloride channel protein [Deinococcus hopiensis]SMB93045.1 H+/Cl-antiporter ClcA [Deinococcus hopiensis KR-140]
MRSPLPRAVLTRLETGRLVVLSLLLGLLVGGLSILLRLALDGLLRGESALLGYAPPGTPGEGGLLMAFGEALPWGLLALPAVGAAYTWLIPTGDPLAELVRGYHIRGQWPRFPAQVRTLAGTLLGQAVGLLVGRDAPFTVMGQMATRLLARTTRLDSVETRTLTLAGAGAALGAVLHAPLAAAVLIVEVLYRRFEFEFEVLMPCVLAAVAAYAVYGLAFGFTPLFSLEVLPVLAASQLPAFLGVALGVTLVGWAGLLACRALPPVWTQGWLRPVAGGAFGLLTAAVALWSTPAVLGDGSGWAQLGLSGFLGPEALGAGAWRWALLALGAPLAFGGGVLPSVGVGGLLGAGLGNLLGLDPAAATLTGVVAFLTVTLNAPLAAALLAVAWGGDAVLPASLLAAGVAHLLSGETGLLPGQVRSRAASAVHAGMPLLPEGIRFAPRRAASAPATPLHPSAPTDEGGPTPLASEQELYRRSVPRSWEGARVSVLTLPPGVEVVGVVRDGTVRLPRPDMRLTAEDELVFLARPDAYQALEGVLRLPGA